MRFELNISVADGVHKVIVDVGDIWHAQWPIQTENPLKNYGITLNQVPATYQGQKIAVELEFDIRSFKLQLGLPLDKEYSVLEGKDVPKLRRHFLRTLILKWREEQTSAPMSHDAWSLFQVAQTEVRHLEGR